MTEEDKAKAVKAEEEAQTKRLERVIKNNERIAEINNLAAKEKRALTIEEYKELDSLRNADSLAELDTLNLSNEQYQLVMTERAKFEESISEEDIKRTRERIAKKDKAEREAAKKIMDDEIALCILFTLFLYSSKFLNSELMIFLVSIASITNTLFIQYSQFSSYFKSRNFLVFSNLVLNSDFIISNLLDSNS